MRFLKSAGCFLLALLLAVLLSLPVLAAEDETEPEPVLLLDTDALTALVEDYMEEKNLDPNRIAVSYCYTGTGEIWMYNGDLFFPGASLYKLPLGMRIASALADGELTPESRIYGYRVGEGLERMLVKSSNSAGEALIRFFDGQNFRAYAASMGNLSETAYPMAYDSTNWYSPRLLLGILLELYRNEEAYPGVIGYMLRANPGEYFRKTLEGEYDVAQKYGSAVPTLNTAGIIYTPRPILLSVLTTALPNAESILGDLAERFAEYTLSLDETLNELDEETLDRAAAQLETTAVSPADSALPILTAFSSEENAEQAETFNAAVAAEAKAVEEASESPAAPQKPGK